MITILDVRHLGAFQGEGEMQGSRLTCRGRRVECVLHWEELLGEASHEEVTVDGVVHVVCRAATPTLDVPVLAGSVFWYK